MPKDNLDAAINAYSSTKHGDVTNVSRDKFSTMVTKGILEDYKVDSRLGKGTFTAIVLRVEQFSESEGDLNYPYEPGSLAMKRYNDGTSEAPKLLAVKARIPFLHNMLPIPDLSWSALEGDCPSKSQTTRHIKKCHHAIIDMYPTFYAEKEDMQIPTIGEYIRVKFGDVSNNRDPVLLGSESGNSFTVLRTTRTGVYGTSGATTVTNSSGHTGGAASVKLTDEEIRAAGENFKGPWGKIITTNPDYSYQLTDEDVLWATKMVIGEGDHREAVLWSMASLLVWHNIYKKALKNYSYYGLINEYSQPIAKKWRRNGGQCKRCKFIPPDDEKKKKLCSPCTKRRLDRRDVLAALTLEEIVDKHSKMLALTTKWAKGEVANPYPACTDFAQGSVARKEIPVSLGGRCTKGDRCAFDHVSYVNKAHPKGLDVATWYVGKKGASTWPSDFVKVVLKSPEKGK